MDVQEDETLAEGYKLKLNSYDLGVDIELADAVQRLRFEHPEVRRSLLPASSRASSAQAPTFTCSGTSSHAFKVNFCKFTNETRCSIEDASRIQGERYRRCAQWHSLRRRIRASDRLRRDLPCRRWQLGHLASRSAAPGSIAWNGWANATGRQAKVRRDRADVFSTLAEGLKGEAREGMGI